MLSFSDNQSTGGLRSFGVGTGASAPVVAEIAYTEDIKQRFIVDAISILHPAETCGASYVLQDDGDGVYFRMWSADAPKPTDAELKPVILSLAESEIGVGLVTSAKLVDDAVNALRRAVDAIFQNGRFVIPPDVAGGAFGNVEFSFGVIPTVMLHLTNGNISKELVDMRLSYYDPLMKTFSGRKFNPLELKDIFLAGSDLKLDIIEDMERVITSIRTLDAVKLRGVIQAPLRVIDASCLQFVKL